MLPASGPRQALDIVRSEPRVDLVVSDVGMAEMQGPELIREIARISPATAGVLMSACPPDPADLPQATPLLQKPFSLDELVSTVEEVLARSAQAQTELRRACERSTALQQQSRRLVCEIEELGCEVADTAQSSHDLVNQSRD